MERDVESDQRLRSAFRRAYWFLVVMILLVLFAAQSLAVLIFVFVLAAVPWEIWISAHQPPPPDGNNREGSLTRWMRTRGFLKRWWRWVAVMAVVVIWAIGATVFSESRGTSLYRQSQLLLLGMSREEVIRTMGSLPAEEVELDPQTSWAIELNWEDDRWHTVVFLDREGKFVKSFSSDQNPTTLTRWSGWLHHRLNWRATDKLWRWSL